MRVSRRGNSTETTGDRIRRARIEGGLSQKELAERLGVSSPTVGQWESGRRNPKDETLQRIAAALGVDVYELKPPYLLNGDIMREWLDLDYGALLNREVMEKKAAVVEAMLKANLPRLNENGLGMLLLYLEFLAGTKEYTVQPPEDPEGA